MASRFFRNKTNKRNQTRKTTKNKKVGLTAGASQKQIKLVIATYKTQVSDLRQQNQVLKGEISTLKNIVQELKGQLASKNAIVQGLKGQNSVYASDQTFDNMQIKNENSSIVQVLNGINQYQLKILGILKNELNKKSPNMDKVNSLAAMNKVGAAAVNEVVSQPQPAASASSAIPVASSATSSNSSSSSSYAVPAAAAATGVAAGVALTEATQANSDAANDLVNHLSNAANSIASPENIKAASDAAQRAAKATGKVLADKNVQKHAVAYATHGLNAAMDTGKYLHDAVNGKATTASTVDLAGKLARHGMNATNSAVNGMFAAYDAAKTSSKK
jgi:hypothetical protein